MSEGPESRSERFEGEEDPTHSDEAGDAENGTHVQRAGADGSGEVLVAVDVNEPDHVWPLVFQHEDVDSFKEVRLASADIVVNGIGFERKTPGDFASSMTEGRLDEQVEKMVEGFDHAYILMERSFTHFDDMERGPSAASMRGMAASVTARYGIPVIPTGNAPTQKERTRLLVDYAIRLGRKHTEDPVTDHLPTGSLGSSEPSGKKMWACLPRVGPTLAERLFETFGSPVQWAVQAGTDDPALSDIEGIGESTAGEIEEAMLDG